MLSGNPFKIAIEKSKTTDVSQRESFDYTDDLQTWKRFKGGDEAAFIYIYKTYFDKLFRLGLQITQDQELIKDCIQDLFIEIRNNRKRLSDTNSIKLYLFKSYRRKIIQYTQNYKKRYDKSVLLESTFPVCISIEEKIINRQITESQIARLNRAIQDLTDQQREIIYHFYYEKLNYKEIADVMGFSHIKSARNLLYKALNNLKGHLISLLLLIFLMH